jgi:hypothetical protein
MRLPGMVREQVRDAQLREIPGSMLRIAPE